MTSKHATANDQATPTISVVIPCHNAATTVAATLASIEASSMKVHEVVCVDDGSSDMTADVVERVATTTAVGIRLICLESNRGAAAARNRGAAEAVGKWLLFVDADVVLGIHAIKNLSTALTGSASSIAAVAMYESTSVRPGPLAGFQALLVHQTYDAVCQDDSPYFGTHTAMVSRTTFRQVGGFDEQYLGASVEDFEMGLRLRQAGVCLRLIQDAHVRHNHGYSWWSFTRNYYSKAAALVALVRRAGPPAAELAGGYASVGNIAGPFLMPCQIVAAVMALRQPTKCRIGFALLPTVAAYLFWRGMVTTAVRHFGVVRALQFVLLRCYATTVGSLGASTALVRPRRFDRKASLSTMPTQAFATECAPPRRPHMFPATIPGGGRM